MSVREAKLAQRALQAKARKWLKNKSGKDLDFCPLVKRFRQSVWFARLVASKLIA
ncbi:MAG TPA: hypothetical protein VFM25_11555 [Verrucomicrobiae bacterium]|nr:hypothetical protein [Verrucomicrobiae bacterium]